MKHLPTCLPMGKFLIMTGKFRKTGRARMYAHDLFFGPLSR